MRLFHLYGNWLVSISWWRFIVLSVLLLIATAILQHLPPFSYTIGSIADDSPHGHGASRRSPPALPTPPGKSSGREPAVRIEKKDDERPRRRHLDRPQRGPHHSRPARRGASAPASGAASAAGPASAPADAASLPGQCRRQRRDQAAAGRRQRGDAARRSRKRARRWSKRSASRRARWPRPRPGSSRGTDRRRHATCAPQHAAHPRSAASATS